MGRTFSFECAGHQFSIRPIAIDEGWELWVMNGEQRIECGARISIDEAVAAAREGDDAIKIAADRLKANLIAKLMVGP